MAQKIFSKMLIACIMACIILASGCAPQPAPGTDGTDISGLLPPSEIPAADGSGATEEGVNAAVSGNNKLALELYRAINKEGDNIFFSPWSISSAFAMVYEGAGGNTAFEMLSALHFPEGSDDRRPAFASIYNTINRKSDSYQLHTANALWAQKGYNFLPEYTGTVLKYYGGLASELDFVSETEKSRQVINAWVEEMTLERIKDLLPQGSVNSMTRLVLTNAIYFKGKWAEQFDKDDTFESDFFVTPENPVKVQMMSMRGERFDYAETDELQILEMPYEGDELSMLIILPKEGMLSGVEDSLTAEKLKELNSAMRSSSIVVYMPKFEMNTRYSLKQALQEMGVRDAFIPMDADLSGMDGTRELYISDAFHKAFVKVDEEGTEAAAATGIVVGITSMPMSEVFRADRPFIFIIQQADTGNILFMGKVSNPLG